MAKKDSIVRVDEESTSRLEKFFDPLAGTLHRARKRSLVKGDGVSLTLMGLGGALFGLGVVQVLEAGGDIAGWTGALYMAISTLNIYNAQGASKRAEETLAADEEIEELTVVNENSPTNELRDSKE